MKSLIVVVVLALVVVFFMLKQKPQVTRTRQIKEKGKMRCRPVYIDQPTVYLDAPITYTEWDTKISSSL